jgi:tetratricopeptide (TPR) repeat protein
MIRVAWITHRKGDRLSAYKAYRDAEDFSESEDVKARCKVECAGLLMELAESGKGNMEEVRRAIAQSLEAISPNAYNRRATLELMYTETYGKQQNPDFATAAQLSEEFVDRWEQLGEQAPTRELSAAMFQAGMYYRRSGNMEKALSYYRRVLNEVPDNAEKFAGFDPKAQALLGLSKIAAENEDYPAYKQILRDIIDMYPQDSVTEKIRQNYPGIEQELQPTTGQEAIQRAINSMPSIEE